MNVAEVEKSKAKGSWLRAVWWTLGIETVLICLFWVEAAAFSWLGTPDPLPDSIVAAEILEFCVTSDGTQGLSLLRLQSGNQGEAFQYSAVLHCTRMLERSAVIDLQHGQPVRVTQCPADDLAAIGCDDGSIYLVACDDKQATPRLLGRNSKGCIHQIEFSPDSRWLVFLDSFSLNAWSHASGSPVHRLSLTSETFSCFAFVPHSQHILIGTLSGAVYTWNIAEPAGPSLFADFGAPVVGLNCSSDGRRVVAASVVNNGGALQVWDMALHERLWRRHRAATSATLPAVFSADCKLVICQISRHLPGSQQAGPLVMLDAATGETRGHLSGHTQPVRNLVLSGDHLLHSGSRDGTIRTWDLRSGQQIQQLSLAQLSAR